MDCSGSRESGSTHSLEDYGREDRTLLTAFEQQIGEVKLKYRRVSARNPASSRPEKSKCHNEKSSQVRTQTVLLIALFPPARP